MDKYLIIDKNANGGIKIKDTITDIAVTYYNYSEREAIRKHRNNMNIKYKHLTKIYLWGVTMIYILVMFLFPLFLITAATKR